MKNQKYSLLDFLVNVDLSQKVDSIKLKRKRTEGHWVIFDIPNEWINKMRRAANTMFVFKGPYERVYLFSSVQWQRLLELLNASEIRKNEKIRFLQKRILSDAYEVDFSVQELAFPLRYFINPEAQIELQEILLGLNWNTYYCIDKIACQ